MLSRASDGKSFYYTDASNRDENHKIEKAADASHLKSILVTATIAPENGFNIADGTYYVTIAVSENTPLRITNNAGRIQDGATDYYYVGATKTVYTLITVANGTFTSFSKTFVLSMTGTDGVDETNLEIAANQGFDYGWATSNPASENVVAMDAAQ